MESDMGDEAQPVQVESYAEGEDDVLVFHWSPTDRRKAILTQGMKVRQLSVDGLWRPPFTCWSPTPSLSWAMSGAIHPEIKSWDLWMCWSSRVRRWEMIPYDDGTPREYRVYHKLTPSKIWYVATRES